MSDTLQAAAKKADLGYKHATSVVDCKGGRGLTFQERRQHAEQVARAPPPPPSLEPPCHPGRRALKLFSSNSGLQLQGSAAKAMSYLFGTMRSYTLAAYAQLQGTSTAMAFCCCKQTLSWQDFIFPKHRCTAGPCLQTAGSRCLPSHTSCCDSYVKIVKEDMSSPRTSTSLHGVHKSALSRSCDHFAGGVGQCAGHQRAGGDLR